MERSETIFLFQILPPPVLKEREMKFKHKCPLPLSMGLFSIGFHKCFFNGYIRWGYFPTNMSVYRCTLRKATRESVSKSCCISLKAYIIYLKNFSSLEARIFAQLKSQKNFALNEVY